MKQLKQLPYYALIAFLTYMPFHILLSQSLSLITGGLTVWKVAKDMLLFILVTVFLGVALWQRTKSEPLKKFVIMGLSYGLVHLFTWVINPKIYVETAFQGTAFNNRLIFFVILGLVAVLLNAKHVTESKLIKLTLIISTIVCALGVLQYFLPKDLLTHIGYSVERGVKPAFFIDDKPDFPRIMSTLRDPNSLGAFLVVPLTLLYGLFIKFRKEAAKRNKIIVLALLHIAALFLTFSRGAWAGAFVAFIVCLITMTPRKFRPSRKLLIITICILVALGAAAFALRDQRTIQHIIQHSDETTVAEQDSNALHLDFAADSLRESVKKPLGHGPGTAGIVSIRNPNGGQLTENYYLQILYEVGFVGLGLFIYAVLYVVKKLRANKTLLGSALVSSMVAYACMAMLMHLWSNEAVAAQWWLLAGAVMGLSLRNKRRSSTEK